MSLAFLLVIELIGTFAFAVSGASSGIGKKMDILGVIVMGLVTAVGGGVIRDLVLGLTPPMTFRNPIYAGLAIASSIFICFPAVRRLLEKRQHLYDTLLLWMDSIGLGVFTVVGIQTACTAGYNDNLWLLIFVGVITGVGGGVIRDVLGGSKPYIFVKHFYASASIIGAIICALIWPYSDSAAMLIGMLATTVLRLCAARFRWKLPKPGQQREAG